MYASFFRRTLAVLLTVAAAVWPLVAQAQDDGRDPALPEIAPREIEIRGTIEIDFPSIQRQPLSGFGAAPAVEVESAEAHAPYVGGYASAQGIVGPPELPQTQASARALAQPPPPRVGTLEATLGRYLTRAVRGTTRLPVSRRAAFTLDAAYRGSDGFEAFDDGPRAGAQTRFDTFEGRAGLLAQTRRATFDLGVFGFLDDYDLYGVALAAPEDDGVPERVSQQIGAEVRVDGEGASGVRYDAEVRAAFTDVASEDDDTSVLAAASSVTEQRVEVGGSVTLPVSRRAVTASARLLAASLSGPDLPPVSEPSEETDGSAFGVGGGADVLLLDGEGLRATAGAHVLVSSSNALRSDDTQTATYVAPAFDVTWTPAPVATVYAVNRPGVRAGGLGNLVAENAFLGIAPEVRPSLYVLDAEAGVRLGRGVVQGTLRGGYVWAPVYRFFTGPANVGASSTDALLNVGYGTAQMPSVGADLATRGLDPVQASVGITFRNPRLTDVARGDLPNGTTDLPYVGPVAGHAVVSVGFLDGKGLAQLTGRVETARPVGLDEDADEVDAFVDVDARVEYMVTPLLGAVVQVQSLGNPDRWAGYPQPATVASVGLRLAW